MLQRMLRAGYFSPAQHGDCRPLLRLSLLLLVIKKDCLAPFCRHRAQYKSYLWHCQVFILSHR